jgi:DNA-binding PadR family transcriptional regulator
MPGRESHEAGAPLVGLDGLEALDRLLEHRLRLALAVLLVRYQELTFARLKEVTGETDGNLGANLRKLEDAGYLTVRKAFVDRKPVSWYAPTEVGRAALRRHLDALARVVAQAGAGAGS